MPELTEQAAVQALIALVEQYCIDQGTPYGGKLPDGICLEMHPLVHHMIMRNWHPGYAEFVSSYSDPQAGPFKRADIKVKVNPELPRGAWRLAVITVDVIEGGVMPGGEGND